MHDRQSWSRREDTELTRGRQALELGVSGKEGVKRQGFPNVVAQLCCGSAMLWIRYVLRSDLPSCLRIETEPAVAAGRGGSEGL